MLVEVFAPAQPIEAGTRPQVSGVSAGTRTRGRDQKMRGH